MTTALAPVPEAQPTRLEGLADDINREHQLGVVAAVEALQHFIRAGEALLVARDQVPHGEWERWLDENCPAVARQARPYMRLASYKDAIPVGTGTLTEALADLRGLPAFDGSGPRRHPPEVRLRALELIGEGLTRRMVASVLGIDKKCVDRWVKPGSQPRSEGSYRTGRPSKAEQKERAAVMAAGKRAIGPAALANCFRAVWEAHRNGPKSALAFSLYELSNSAVDWAEQVER